MLQYFADLYFISILMLMSTGCLAPLAPRVIPGSHCSQILLSTFSLLLFIFGQDWAQYIVIVVVSQKIPFPSSYPYLLSIQLLIKHKTIPSQINEKRGTPPPATIHILLFFAVCCLRLIISSYFRSRYPNDILGGLIQENRCWYHSQSRLFCDYKS